jgi:hypothetical protein
MTTKTAAGARNASKLAFLRRVRRSECGRVSEEEAPLTLPPEVVTFNPKGLPLPRLESGSVSLADLGLGFS